MYGDVETIYPCMLSMGYSSCCAKNRGKHGINTNLICCVHIITEPNLMSTSYQGFKK